MRWFKLRIKSVGFALKGFKIAWKEPHIKIHLLAIVVVILGGFWIEVSLFEWMVILLCFAIVVATELVNTAIEKLADRITTNQDSLIGQAKDIAAGAVLFASIISAIIGFIIVLNHV